MNSFDITKYIDMALRRRYWIIVPFLISCLAGLGYIMGADKVFQAKTLILVQAQKVPTDFVQSIISSGIEDRIRTITQQVTSRTNLERIIKEHGLYNDPSDKDLFMEQKVDILRQKVNINVSRAGGGGDAFSISFQGNNPEKVMKVTNALASNFITENLKIRESQAMGTSAFIAEELESTAKRLTQKEGKLKEYRLKNMGALPEQLQTNLNILGQLQMQQEQLSSSLNSARSRKLIIQQQIAETGTVNSQLLPMRLRPNIQQTPEEGEEDELTVLNRRLQSLKGRYTENHPEIIRIKEMILSLESKKAENDLDSDMTETPEPEDNPAPSSNENSPVSSELLQVDMEIKQLEEEIKYIRSKTEQYQFRVEETPKKEQELLTLSRDYDNLRELYNSLLGRKLEAEIAVSMEKKQKGEQFRIIDPAKVPNLPIKPDIKKIALMVLALGLGLGAGLGYLIEMMDSSFRNPEEVEKELEIPVLVDLPIIYTKPELRRIKIKNIMIPLIMFICFMISAVTIVVVIKGKENVLMYVKSFLG